MKTFAEGYLGYAGQIDNSSGYGRSGYAAFRNLAASGVHLTHQVAVGDNGETPRPRFEFMMPYLEQLDQATVGIIGREDREETEWTLLHSIPTPLPFLKSPKKVVWTMWETHRIPSKTPWRGYSHWDHLINTYAQALIVPTQSQLQLFRDSGVQHPAGVVHMAIDTEAFPYVERPRRNRPFTFFSWSFMEARKCPIETVNSFLSAFGPNNPDVRLVMKTLPGMFGMGRLGVPSWNVNNVQIIQQHWPHEQLMRFLATEVDACIFLSHGEGFFMPPLEALSTGLPVVVSDNTGSSDFCDERYLYPVGQKGLVPATAWGEGALWVEPDYDQAIERMRNVYHDYDIAVAKAKAGSAWVRERWSRRHQRGDLMDVLSRLCS